MKGLVSLMISSLLLIGCGQMKTNEDTAMSVLNNMEANGSLDGSDLNLNDESLLDESVQLSETAPNSIMMKFGGAELLIDFIEDFGGQQSDTAMVINGVEVAAGLLQNPESFQGLLASLLTAQLEKVDILGVPAPRLVQVGLELIRGDKSKADLSNIFGSLVRGALNMYLSKTPFGSLFEQILRPVVDRVLPGSENGQTVQQPQQPAQPAQPQLPVQQPGGIKQTIVSTIGGLISGSNPILGGIFNLIANRIK